MSCSTQILVAVTLLLAPSTYAQDGWTPSPLCPYPSETKVRFAYEGDCSKYWECFEGVRYPMDCPEGFEFNAEAIRCDDPQVSNCNPEATIVYPTFSHSVKTTTIPSETTPDPGPAPDCPFPSDELTFYPVSNNCAQYWECFQGNGYLMTCPGDLLWNVLDNYCDFQVNVDCSLNTVTTSTSTSTVTTPTTSTSTTPTPTTSTSTTPTPTTPTSTTSTTATPTTPTSTTPTTATPTTPTSTTPTTATPTTSTSTTSTTPTTTASTVTTTTEGTTTEWAPDPDCPYPSEELVFIPNPSNCSQYFECFEGKKFTMSCPEDMYWNEIGKNCDYKDKVNCNQASTSSTSSRPTTLTTVPTTVNAICEGEPDGTYLANPEDCSRFYECVRGMPTEGQCPGQLVWNEPIHSCDYLYNVVCENATLV